MASGTFKSSTCTAAGSGYYRYIEVVWSSTNDTTNNKSTITWNAYSRCPNGDTTSYVYAKNIKVVINGTSTTLVGSTSKALYHGTHLGGSTITVSHGTNGKKSVSVSITAQIYVYGSDNSTYSGSITMTPNPVYTLSLSAGTGSSITVNRTSCPVSGKTGNLSAGSKKLYHDDKLKITFTLSSNYSITTHTVNGSAFTSNNTHTVSGNVSVVATATPLKSVVSATDANIGSATTITITRYNSAYTHTLTYSFGGLTGTIETKTTNTSVGWTVPTSFYAKIPNDPSGTCTITCTTYNGNTSLGSSTCTFTATAAKNISKPVVTGTVEADDSFTEMLTGSKTTLIKNKSTALCTLTATPQNSATTTSIKICGTEISGTADSPSSTVTGTKKYTNVSLTSFDFYAKDSRGYETTTPVTPTMVNYINLTCNPSIYRDTPTGNSISMDVSGNFYRGAFGTHANAKSNTLTLMYRYKQVGGSYPSTAQTLEDGTTSDANGWITVDTSLITKGTKSYRSTNTLSLQSYPTTDDSGNTVYEGFDYHIDYEFQVKVFDGAAGYTLTTVTKTVNVPRGIPVFDWGENDFNFNVPVMLSINGQSINILNIMYPVGAVYMHSSSTIPTVLDSVGTWSSVTTGISGVYAWKRTA